MTFPAFPDSIDRNLVFDFFWMFSAFECALKRGDFLKASRNQSPDSGTDNADRRCPAHHQQRKGRAAEADWDKFGRVIDSEFAKLKSPAFLTAVARIKCLSPQRQINANGKLKWDPVKKETGETDAAYTLHLLRTVRNNLLHGGKYPDGGPSRIAPVQIARDKEILGAAVIILDGCYELHPDIKRLIDDIARGCA